MTLLLSHPSILHLSVYYTISSLSMAAPRSAAVQIVRPSSPSAGTGASEGTATGKKGKLAYSKGLS
jgi:hypothetical protein